jgi:hypothetical protein
MGGKVKQYIRANRVLLIKQEQVERLGWMGAEVTFGNGKGAILLFYEQDS